MSNLARVIEIAAKAHAVQEDKAGAPYILHPLRVMFQMRTEEEMIVAVLHDVLEDAKGWNAKRLAEEGFTKEIVEAIECLTKRPSEKKRYASFIRRAGKNPLARRVKLADLKDNMDIRRLKTLKDGDVGRLKKYLRGYRVLQELQEQGG